MLLCKKIQVEKVKILCNSIYMTLLKRKKCSDSKEFSGNKGLGREKGEISELPKISFGQWNCSPQYCNGEYMIMFSKS